jgi:hypothetical protein
LYVDHLTGYIVVHFLKKKSEVLSSIKKFVRDNVDFYGLDIKRLHVDFDPNYKDQAVQDWLLEKGISMSFSTPYHHQGNGRAERTVRKVLEAARTLMIEANAPYSLMDKYVEMAVWLLNRTPNDKLENKTPYEAVTGIKPDLSYCVPVNAQGYAHISPESKPNKHKMDPVAEKVTLLGYSEDKGSYLVKTKDGKIKVRRDVRFDENVATAITPDSVNKYSEKAYFDATMSTDPIDCEETYEEEDDPSIAKDVQESNDDSSISSSDTEYEEQQHSTVDDNTDPELATIHKASDRSIPIVYNRMPLRSGNTKTYTSADIYQVSVDESELERRRQEEFPYTPNNCYEAFHPNNPWRREWIIAVCEEMDEQIGRVVFREIDPDKVDLDKLRPFQSRFVFKVKKEDDKVVKFKARLVVKGFSQRYGIDYDETFAPTISFSTILAVLHIAATNNWNITGCDIGNAYLEALTNRELYMTLPYDWSGKDENGNQRKVVVQLLRNLYGSKQAALLWYNHLYAVLSKYGFKRLVHEPCCFKHVTEDGNTLIVCVYVDDLLITGSSQECIDHFKKFLASNFEKIKDLNDLPRYLGLQMERLQNGQITLSQSDYIRDIIKEYGM